MAYLSSTRRNAGFNLNEILTGAVAAIKLAAQRRAVYLRTLRELETLNDRELNDLGMSRASLRSIAHEAAYGA